MAANNLNMDNNYRLAFSAHHGVAVTQGEKRLSLVILYI